MGRAAVYSWAEVVRSGLDGLASGLILFRGIVGQDYYMDRATGVYVRVGSFLSRELERIATMGLLGLGRLVCDVG